jgi:HlyD family secretion protein
VFRNSPSRAVQLASVRQFQSEVATIREGNEPKGAIYTLRVFTALVVASLVAILVVRLDRVVSSTHGKMVTTEPPIVFGALDTSLVKSIDAKVGQRVEKGQLLATLDPTFAAASVNQLKAQIDSLQTQIARDRAELDGAQLVFQPNDDPDYGKYEKIQRELFNQHTAQFASQLLGFEQKIAGSEATIAKFKIDEGRYGDQERVAKQVEDMRRTEQEHGTGALLNLLIAAGARVESHRQALFDHNSVVESEQLLASQRADKEAYIQQTRTTTTLDLVKARNDLDTAVAQLDAALKHQELVRLTAPEASVVLSVANVSVGSVLQIGVPLITLTPIRAPLEARIWVSPRDVGFVRPGDSASIKVDAFSAAEHGTAQGKVRWISPDAFTLDDNGQPTAAHYKAGIEVSDADFHDVPASFRLEPGMTLTADIGVGSRSLAQYLIGSMINTVDPNMRDR